MDVRAAKMVLATLIRLLTTVQAFCVGSECPRIGS